VCQAFFSASRALKSPEPAPKVHIYRTRMSAITDLKELVPSINVFRTLTVAFIPVILSYNAELLSLVCPDVEK
jgi:hypothetical protein